MTGKGYTVSELLGLQILSECGESARKNVKSIILPQSGLKGFIIFSVKKDAKDAAASQAEEFKDFIRTEAKRFGLREKPGIDTYYEIPNAVTIGTLLEFKDDIARKSPKAGYDLYIYVVRNGDFFLL